MHPSFQPALVAVPTSASRDTAQREAQNDPQWRANELLLVREIIRLIGKSLAPEVVMREILHLMSELLGLNRGRIVLADPSPADGEPPATRAGRKPRRGAPAATSRICYAYGLTRDEIASGVYACGEGVTGRVLATGKPILVQDIHADTQFLGRAMARTQQPMAQTAFMALPIQVNHQTVGVLGCLRERHLRPLNDDIALLQVLATLAGQVLARQTLMQQTTRALEVHNKPLTHAPASAAARYGIVGNSAALLRALGELERVSQANASVLLLGESGTGKALFARALHLASPRRDAPFITVNCAAMPDTLFESELFGADQGTIFLDEVGEMPLVLQTQLLRTLQEGSVVRPGGKREGRVNVQIDVRVVAATQRDLAADVARGAFRRDLYYRLNVIPIQLPALRERREDIRTLAVQFVNRANQVNRRNVKLSAGALQQLEDHAWPGNIRELGNVIERLVLLTDSTVVSASEMARFLPHSAAPVAAPALGKPPPLVREYTHAHSHSPETLQAALALHKGNQSRAAQALGLTARQFSYRLQKAGLR